MRQAIQFRQAAQKAQPAPDPAAPAAPAQPAPVSFATDIMPIFKQFQGPMMWRLDLTSYEAVMANAATIYGRISDPGNPMPPPPFPPLTAAQIQTFNQWMLQGCPP
jgi:hypothetical protein